MLATYLDELLDHARARVRTAAATRPLAEMRERALARPAGASLAAALGGEGVGVIAEVKRASPSRGQIAPDLDAVAQARAYQTGGAAAVSVLTEPSRFLGTLDDLAAVSQLGVPTLRKDFLVDPYQVWEARLAGASAVLLIVAALDDATLADLAATAVAADLDVLVEVHDADEIIRAARIEPSIVGVNARDLRTFEVDLAAFARLRGLLPTGAIAVAESGISTPDDVRAVVAAGADAVLVGEELVRSADPAAAVTALRTAMETRRPV